MMAAGYGHIEVLKMLLDKNANIETVNEVSRNVNMACTALRYIIIIMMMMMIIIIITIILIIVMNIIVVIFF